MFAWLHDAVFKSNLAIFKEAVISQNGSCFYLILTKLHCMETFMPAFTHKRQFAYSLSANLQRQWPF